MKVFLDTTALIVHAMGQTGAELVQSYFTNEENEIFISALSLFELASVFHRCGLDEQIPQVWAIYSEVAQLISVDADLARAAWQLRVESGQRIPIADAIIAASARAQQAILLHRDQHLTTIPKGLLSQQVLPPC